MHEAASVIQDELGTSEQLLWSGIPRRGFVLRKSDLYDIPIGLLIGGLIIWWTFRDVRGDIDITFIVWGLPFVLFAIYVAVGRFFFDIWKRNRTYYGVTNERIIALTNGLFAPKIRALNIDACQDATIDLLDDGSGTIIFFPITNRNKTKKDVSEPPPKIVHRSFRFSPMPPTSEIKYDDGDEYEDFTFEMIPDAKSVYNLIRQTQQSN